MDKRIEPELLSITPDLDQVEDFKRSQTKSNIQAPPSEPSTTVKAAPAKSSAATWLSAVAIIALAAGGFGLYQQNLATQAQLKASEQRIAELERALSATGEEMGESAGAIQAKLSAVATRTDELWTQMDNLWASAWRRNQAEIKELKEQSDKFANSQTKQLADMASSNKTLSQTQTELGLKVSLLQEQLQATTTLKSQLAALNNDLDKLKSQSQSRDAKQIEIGATMAQLEMTQTALTERLERLEKSLVSAAKTPPNPN
ncbi:hypothetical protein ACFOEE_00515 [Pseudoalteromonas fenneropenaei]|uniref:Uncharacterized protein n=1 Tax=Pseudoalteromonas fenneropenaei TaxID=1737459 RepID=A0ABV7CC96_9GAMM